MAQQHSRSLRKFKKVMSEFKRGMLRSSTGHRVTSRKQALAIAASEAGVHKKKRGRK